MILKTYKANTNVSINVVLPSKKNLHVSFTPLSDGSSVFQTDNVDIQNAIERHYNYGKLFRLVSVSGNKENGLKVPDKKAHVPAPAPVESKEETTGSETASEQKPEAEETAQEQATATVEEESKVSDESETPADETPSDESETPVDENGLRKVNVTDIAAAKDYLATTFGISRTTMRSTKSILEKAAENGIQFVGL